jgi:hypothetical protein
MKSQKIVFRISYYLFYYYNLFDEIMETSVKLTKKDELNIPIFKHLLRLRCF